MSTHASALAAMLMATGPVLVLGRHATSTQPVCATTAELTTARRWRGDVDSQRVCLCLRLERGAFARVALGGGDALGVFLEVTVFGPGDSIPFLRTPVRGVLSWEARRTGEHTIVLSALRRVRDVSITLSAVEDSGTRAAQRRGLARDPRVAWLAAHAIPIRTLQPGDADFRDLRPLLPLLADVRVLLLGEADHGDGSDFLAKSRLIRFLHAEAGFDVLAWEGGVYDMWRAWRDIKAGRDPMASFAQGPNWRWAQARQLEPLVRYVALVAHSPRPLVLAGIDVQRTGRTAPADTMITELSAFLQSNGLGGPFADVQSPESQVLRRLHDYQYRPVPDSGAMAAFGSAVSATAGRIERDVATHDGRYWARVLWNVAARAAWVWPRWPGARRPYCPSDACRNMRDRDPEMAQNLMWLANQMFPDRRIVVWAHSAHVARNLPTDLMPCSLGDAVWSAFAERSYSIGLVSHDGAYRLANAQAPTFDIIPDQDPEAEFEELMTAAGHRFALVDLRSAAPDRAWLGEPFLARPIGHATERHRWGASFDAFVFIGTQEPTLTIPWP